MRRWLELYERELGESSRFAARPWLLEAVVGVREGAFSEEDVALVRACTASTAAELVAMLQDARHRHLVKLLIFAAEHVPEPLLRPMLRAAVHTRDPSCNKHFVHPCVLQFGRRRVVSELIALALAGNDDEKAGAAAALYWGAMPREQIFWPHHARPRFQGGEPDAPVEDLLAPFAEWAVEEFVRNEHASVRRAFVHHVAAVRERRPALAQAAIDLVRESPDPYLRDRLRYDLGESALLPCLPPR